MALMSVPLALELLLVEDLLMATSVVVSDASRRLVLVVAIEVLVLP